jgi:hypothetical protein
MSDRSNIALAVTALLVSGCLAQTAGEGDLADVDLGATEEALSGTIFLRNLSTGNCLNALTEGALPRAARVATCADTNLQRWRVQRDISDDNIVTFVNIASGLCLDSNRARELYTFPCNGGAFQKWFISETGRTLQFLQNEETGFCLEGAGGGSTLNCNGAESQRWSTMLQSPPRTKYSGVIDHGGNALESERVDAVGGEPGNGRCSPGFVRVSPPQITHEGHGWCAFDGWENPFDSNDCRAKIRIHDSAGWLRGHCNWAIFEQRP